MTSTHVLTAERAPIYKQNTVHFTSSNCIHYYQQGHARKKQNLFICLSNKIDIFIPKCQTVYLNTFAYRNYQDV